MKKRFQFKIIICVYIFLATFCLCAEDSANVFNQANRFYEQGKYSEATAAYEKLIHSGSASTPVYFNSGNTFLKSGQLGRAIAAYRQAEKVSPRDPDVRANLRFARDQAGARSHQGWQTWIGRLTVNEWTVATAIATSIWFLLLAARQLQPTWTKSFRGGLLALGILSSFLVVCLAYAIHQEFFVKLSVVIVPEAVVRRGPLDESQSAFTLRDGAEITVLDKKGDWLQITDASQRTGWLPQRQAMEWATISR